MTYFDSDMSKNKNTVVHFAENVAHTCMIFFIETSSESDPKFILCCTYITNLVCYTYFHWFFSPECFGVRFARCLNKEYHTRNSTRGTSIEMYREHIK
jgi:hypothetical protein